MLGRILNLCVFAALSILPTRAFPQQITASESGITATTDGVNLQVTALREDILRVRMWQGNTAPEDASWAVLPQARTSSVPVTPQALGFTTKSLNVAVSDHLQLTVADLQGNLLQKDAAPVI